MANVIPEGDNMFFWDNLETLQPASRRRHRSKDTPQVRCLAVTRCETQRGGITVEPKRSKETISERSYPVTNRAGEICPRGNVGKWKCRICPGLEIRVLWNLGTTVSGYGGLFEWVRRAPTEVGEGLLEFFPLHPINPVHPCTSSLPLKSSSSCPLCLCGESLTI